MGARPAIFPALAGGARVRNGVASSAEFALHGVAPKVNVHHLELFYYVAKHGGISAAVRHIPYGIQQPAVSGQMGKLEEDAGAQLFERSPFRLTSAGEVLFEHVRPFFENLGPLAAELRESGDPELRLGGSEFVLREHIPTVMQRTKVKFPRLRFSMRTGFQVELEEWLRKGDLDLAATLVEERPPARLRRLRLANVPLVLLVPRASPIRFAEELWAKKKLREPLVSLPPATILMRNFQRGLKRLGVTWPQTVEAGSIDLTTRYVANGDGFGVNIGIDSVVKHRDVRVLPLEGFAPLTMGVIWRGEPSPLVRAVIEEVQRYSRETWPTLFVEDELP
jgi:DNA-binding transcriptional LysR family regulator